MPKIGLHTLAGKNLHTLAGKKEAEMSTKEKLWFVLELFKLLLEDTEIYKDIESMLTGAHPHIIRMYSSLRASRSNLRKIAASAGPPRNDGMSPYNVPFLSYSGDRPHLGIADAADLDALECSRSIA